MATEMYVQEQIRLLNAQWRETVETMKSEFETEIKELQAKLKEGQTENKSSKDKTPIEKYKERYNIMKKEANAERPTIKMNGTNFETFKEQMAGWMKSLNPIVKKTMEELEKPKRRTTDEKEIRKAFAEEMRDYARVKYKIELKTKDEEEERDIFEEEFYDTISMKMWQIITHCVEGDAKRLANNAEQSGTIGWIQLVSHYDPRKGIDMSSDMARVVYPTQYIGKAKDIHQAKIVLNDYLQEITKYNLKYPFDPINPEIEIMAIRALMPEEVNNKITLSVTNISWWRELPK